MRIRLVAGELEGIGWASQGGKSAARLCGYGARLELGIERPSSESRHSATVCVTPTVQPLSSRSGRTAVGRQ